MVEIRCLKCKHEFNISKDQIKKIEEFAIGQMGPSDYLEFFPLISGRCNDKKHHAFVYTEKFMEEKKVAIQNHDDCNKSILDVQKVLAELQVKSKKLTDEKAELMLKLDKIRDEQYNTDQKINEISLTTIPDKHRELEQTIITFDNVTGTRKIDMWR
jgi:hypothetical protein